MRSRRAEHDDPRVAVIDEYDTVHMAHMDIHFGFSINGVAALHTKILEDTELHPFYEIYPEKFSNKTNGHHLPPAGSMEPTPRSPACSTM